MAIGRRYFLGLLGTAAAGLAAAQSPGREPQFACVEISIGDKVLWRTRSMTGTLSKGEVVSVAFPGATYVDELKQYRVTDVLDSGSVRRFSIEPHVLWGNA